MAFTALAFSLNVFMDPYLVFGVPRISGLNSYKAAADSHQRLMKAYDALRYPASTLILGPSPVDVGLVTRSSAWPEYVRPVYNLGLPSSGPYVNFRYLQHVMSKRHISTVVLGLEFSYFLEFEDAGEPNFEARLGVRSDGTPSIAAHFQAVKDVAYAALSLDAMEDSALALMAAFNGHASNLLPGGDYDWIGLRPLKGDVGSYPGIILGDLRSGRFIRDRPGSPRALSDVEAILNLCKSQHTRVILFISPSYVDDLEILDLAGHWSWYEDWKRTVLALASKYSSTPPRLAVQLWDFSGYDEYSTEPISDNGKRLRWFVDCCHYTTALGDAILKTLFSEGDRQFGALLTPENIERHLLTLREQQRVYRESNRPDAQRVCRVYGLTPPVPTKPGRR